MADQKQLRENSLTLHYLKEQDETENHELKYRKFYYSSERYRNRKLAVYTYTRKL